MLRHLRGREHRLAALAQSGFSKADHFDHALVGFLRAGAEREDAVLVQDEANHLRIGVVDLGRFLRERETRHDVGHHAHAAVVDFPA